LKKRPHARRRLPRHCQLLPESGRGMGYGDIDEAHPAAERLAEKLG
jgi:hypothetical protein